MAIEPHLHVLGYDPKTIHRLNACSYQASAIVSFKEYQYAAFYTTKDSDTVVPRFVTLARRRMMLSDWEMFSFMDYKQETDDGHNTISIGVCKADGTIHVSFDHHANVLKYRVSIVGLALSPDKYEWSAKHFSTISNSLGKQQDAEHQVDAIYTQVTYPQFVSAGDELLLEYRTGKAGAGSDVLWRYDPRTLSFNFIGVYLIGRGCNPYINGISFESSTNKLHVSWTNRLFFEYEGHDDPSSTDHQVQAGPNGPENNQDLCYSTSLDMGRTWYTRSNEPKVVSSNEPSSGLLSTDPDLVAVPIPKNSGIMNQESQCLDSRGVFHVLNRENISGIERWMHYFRPADSSHWMKFLLPNYNPTPTGPRGSIACHPRSKDVFFVLPSNHAPSLHIMRASSHGLDWTYTQYWTGDGFQGEPLIDHYALESHDLLSIFTTQLSSDALPSPQVVVLDFHVV